MAAKNSGNEIGSGDGDANSQIAHAVELALGLRCSASNISVDIDGTPTTESLLRAIGSQNPLPVSPDAITQAAEALKFAAYLPEELRTRMLEARLAEPAAWGGLMGRARE